MTKDDEHLRLLSIFHFVVAGLTFLFAMLPVIHLIVGLALVSGAIRPSGGEEVPAFFGWFFVLFASGWILCGVALAVLIALCSAAGITPSASWWRVCPASSCRSARSSACSRSSFS